MTTAGSLIAYMQNEWTPTVPTVAQIDWNEDWFDTKKILIAQIIVRDGLTQELHSHRDSGGTLKMRLRRQFTVNLGHFIKTGAPGTLELTRVENMRREIRRIFVEGIKVDPANHYGGSLLPVRIALPRPYDLPLHESDVQPKLLRYQMTLDCTEDIA